MPNYYVNEAAFALPDRPFVDRTVHTLSAPLPSGEALRVLVTHRAAAAGRSLREMVDGYLASAAEQASGRTVLDAIESTLGGLPALLLRCRWRQEGAVAYDLQAHVIVDGTWMQFAVSGPFAEHEGCDEVFSRLIDSLTWRSA